MKDNEKINAGQLIAKIRKGKKITQEDLEFKIDISRKQLSNIERNVHDPSLVTFVKIAYALDLNPSELLKHIEDAGLLEQIELTTKEGKEK